MVRSGAETDLAVAKRHEKGDLFMVPPVAHKLYDWIELWLNPLGVSPPTNAQDDNRCQPTVPQDHYTSHEV